MSALPMDDNAMRSVKWALTLQLDDVERLEARLGPIIAYAAPRYNLDQWMVSGLEATGEVGNKWADLLNDHPTLPLSTAELLTIIEEDGQIIEMTACLLRDAQPVFEVRVLDGYSVDVLGTGAPIPAHLLGNYTDFYG